MKYDVEVILIRIYTRAKARLDKTIADDVCDFKLLRKKLMLEQLLDKLGVDINALNINQ